MCPLNMKKIKKKKNEKNQHFIMVLFLRRYPMEECVHFLPIKLTLIQISKQPHLTNHAQECTYGFPFHHYVHVIKYNFDIDYNLNTEQHEEKLSNWSSSFLISLRI